MTDDPIRVGILETGRLPETLAGHGDYVKMVGDWFAPVGVTPRGYAVLDGVLPDSPDEADVWLITGSRFGAYEDHPWIAPLEAFIRDVRDAGVPMVGICFGHQVIARALGGRVAKSDKGWGVGVHEYKIRNWPEELGPPPATMRLRAFHQDQVETLPEGAEVIASSPFCEYAALWYPGFAVTFQAHPEYRPEFAADLIRVRTGTAFDQATAEGGLRTVGEETTASDLAERVRGWVMARRHRSTE